MPSKEMSIMFSGGSDSTLAAALMMDHFDRIHLLTFFHSGIPLSEKSDINAAKLADKFGKVRIIHKFINFENLFKVLYYNSYLNSIIKYRSYLTPCSCIACQLAMHTCQFYRILKIISSMHAMGINMKKKACIYIHG